MRPRNIEKKELTARLKNQFNINEPIFTEEILASWSEYSRPRVFQILKELCAEGEIVRYALGVYYFPELTFLGTQGSLSATKVAEKRYVRANNKTFGYYSGLTLLNMVGLTNQVPNMREIVTTNETTRVREVNIGRRRFLVRRAKAKITEENAPALQMLEIFNAYNKPLENYQIENILALAGDKQINKKLIYECAKYFPKRALQNLKKSEISYVLA